MKTFTLNQLPAHSLVDFSEIQALYLSPFPGQRSHRLHLKEAPYLKNSADLWGDQLVFHSVRYPTGEGRKKTIEHKLCDGYTRVLSVLEGIKQRPAKVLLITHSAPDYESAYALYSQFNSTQASKRGKHSMQSGIREATTSKGKPEIDCFSSHLMLKAAVTSGITYSGVPGQDVRKKTSRAFDSLMFIDKMGLTKGTETSGMMSAYIAIVERDRTRRPTLVKEFIHFVNHQGEVEVDKLEDNAIVMARDFHDERRANRTTSGQRNVVTIRDKVLAYYQLFLDFKTKGASATLRCDMDIGAFKLAA